LRASRSAARSPERARENDAGSSPSEVAESFCLIFWPTSGDVHHWTERVQDRVVGRASSAAALAAARPFGTDGHGSYRFTTEGSPLVRRGRRLVERSSASSTPAVWDARGPRPPLVGLAADRWRWTKPKIAALARRAVLCPGLHTGFGRNFSIPRPRRSRYAGLARRRREGGPDRASRALRDREAGLNRACRLRMLACLFGGLVGVDTEEGWPGAPCARRRRLPPLPPLTRNRNRARADDRRGDLRGETVGRQVMIRRSRGAPDPRRDVAGEADRPPGERPHPSERRSTGSRSIGEPHRSLPLRRHQPFATPRRNYHGTAGFNRHTSPSTRRLFITARLTGRGCWPRDPVRDWAPSSPPSDQPPHRPRWPPLETLTIPDPRPPARTPQARHVGSDRVSLLSQTRWAVVLIIKGVRHQGRRFRLSVGVERTKNPARTERGWGTTHRAPMKAPTRLGTKDA
jgi:hypothetical protein